MSKIFAKWVSLDTNSLEDNGSGGLRVKVVGAGAIEATASGLDIKTGGITNDMLAGSIASSKLADEANIGFLNQAETLSAVWDFATFLPTASANPTSDNQLARKAYVDSVVQGLKGKGSVAVLADSNQTLSGVPANIDGITSLVAGDKILLTGQSTGSENGIWEISAGAWTRPSNFATGSNASASFVFVEEGTVYGDQGWFCTNDTGSAVVDTATLTWEQFSSAGQVTAGNGLQKVGSEISVLPDSTTGGNVVAVNVTATGTGLDVSTIAGTGIEADGSGNLRLASQGNGISGGAGSTLSVDSDTDTGGSILGVNVTANGVGVDVDALDGNGLTPSGTTLAVEPDITSGGDVAPVAVSGNGVGLDVTTLDGDHLDIDFTPTNYTPDATPAEANDVDDLSAHLKGIDDAFAGISTETTTKIMHLVTAGEDTAGFLTLPSTPASAGIVSVTPVHGPQQVNKQIVGSTGATPDFDVLNNTELHINNNGTATGLTGEIATGDVLIIEYVV